MKRKLLLLLLLVNLLLVKGQSLDRVYEYDQNGNRICRKVLVLRSKDPSNMDTISSDKDTIQYNENIGSIKLNVFPNPTKDFVKIEIVNFSNIQSSNIKIYTINGQLLENLNFNNNIMEVDLTNYTPSTYLLEITVNNHKETWKIIKN
jgi:hypothetical protein